MSGIDGIRSRFKTAITDARAKDVKVDKATLDQAVSEAALDDGQVDTFEKQEIANQFAKLKATNVTPDGMAEYVRLRQAWGLPEASATTPVSWLSKDTPFQNASNMLMLTDGRVMCQSQDTAEWWLLTPDKNGSYADGTWTQAASMSKGRMYYSSSVLDDGRVLVAGGEYTDGGAQTEDATAEIYDPQKNTWSPITGPGWNMIGDGASTVLQDGRVLLGSLADDKTVLYDPKANTWTDAGAKLAPSAEESWVTLRDGSVLTVDCSPARAGMSELWVPDTKGGGQWIDAGKLPVDLVQASSEEIGPAILMNDGRAFFAGATGHTAIYTPSTTPGQPGSWAAGPDLPKDDDGNFVAAKDAPAALLTNGHILLTGSSLGGEDDGFGGPTRFFDYDPAANALNEVDPPDNASNAPFTGRMLMLPNGEVAYTQASAKISFLSTGSARVTSPSPSITGSPPSAAPGTTLTLTGLGFNGASQDIGYGDDAAAATNYPLARLIAPDGSMQYLRTHDHSTMAVATGDTPVTTQVDLPATLAPGAYQLQIVTNGVPSVPVPLNVAAPAPPATDTSGPGTTGATATDTTGAATTATTGATTAGATTTDTPGATTTGPGSPPARR
jgi:hypothetical protein